MNEIINKEIDSAVACISGLKNISNDIETAVNLCVETVKNGGKIIICGNGCSAGDSQHLVACLACKFRKNRDAIKAVALTTNQSLITAVSNDFGFDKIFERQLEAIGNKGDILIGMSTSGNSKNVVFAFDYAKLNGIKTISFTGETGGLLKDKSDVCIKVKSSVSSNIQEAHITIGHILCGLIESEIFK